MFCKDNIVKMVKFKADLNTCRMYGLFHVYFKFKMTGYLCS